MYRKRPVYEERLVKETYICEKRPVNRLYLERDLHVSKETCI